MAVLTRAQCALLPLLRLLLTSQRARIGAGLRLLLDTLALLRPLHALLLKLLALRALLLALLLPGGAVDHGRPPLLRRRRALRTRTGLRARGALRAGLRRPRKTLRHCMGGNGALLRHRARRRRGTHGRLGTRGRRMECRALRSGRPGHRRRTGGGRSMRGRSRWRASVWPGPLWQLRHGANRDCHRQRHNNRQQASPNCHRPSLQNNADIKSRYST